MTKAFDNAIKFAEELGFKVFPVKPMGKLPLTPRGFKDASNDPMQLLEWNRKWPTANWAVATGIESGILIIDIDGEQGSDWWDEQWFPSGVEVVTPRGGRHIYYAYTDPSIDISIGQKAFHTQIDWRGNGGYALLPGSATSSEADSTYGDGEYVGKLADFPELPQGVIDLIPERKIIERDSEDLDVEGKPEVESEGGKRVIKGALDRLDALPVPWRKGAGYHETQFNVACHLWRIARSKHYALTEEQAYRLFMQHAPVNPEAREDLQTKRWNSAREATEGEAAEHPGEVPVRLPSAELLDKFPDSKIDRLFWESRTVGDVKDLIRALRSAGADRQEAYSVSYDSAGMKGMRERNPTGNGSSWSLVAAEYANVAMPDDDEDGPESEDEQAGEDIPAAPSKRPAVSPMKRLMTDEEREIIEDYPNFIDRYVAVNKDMFSEPNLPLVYLNAWMALSVGIGDRGRIVEEGKTTPLNLWGLNIAQSGSGKGDAKNGFINTTRYMRVGADFGTVDVGDDISAEGLNKVLADPMREASSSVMTLDEADAVLRAFKNPKDYYYKLGKLLLRLYDGRGTRSVRSGTDVEDAGTSYESSFNMWLQTTIDGAMSSMDDRDVKSGLIGRLIFAIGNPPRITRDSLRIRLASEEQVSQGGVNPMVRSLAEGAKTRFGPSAIGQRMHFSDDVNDRLVDARMALLEAFKGGNQEEAKIITLRLGMNILKGACLIALSEGRTEVVMTDLLIALRSGEYWLRDLIRMLEGMGQTDQRKIIDDIVAFIATKPRLDSEILKMPSMKNVDQRDVQSALSRAESEGLIIKPKGNKKWEIQ